MSGDDGGSETEYNMRMDVPLGDAMAGQEVLAPFVLCFWVKPFTDPISLDGGLVAEDSECNLMEGSWATLNGSG